MNCFWTSLEGEEKCDRLGCDSNVIIYISSALYFRSVRAGQAALNCLRKAMRNFTQGPKPRVVLVSDTPAFVRSIKPNISEFAEVGFQSHLVNYIYIWNSN